MATALVVGANRGIGLELCKQLKARGDQVIAACRNSSADLDSLDVPIHTDIDVTNAAALKGLATTLGEKSVDVLIVVAGVLRRVGIDAFDADVVRQQFEVNALGPLQTTVALLDCLADGSKVALITSRMGSIADNTSGSHYGYRMSKAALNMAGRSLALDLKSRGTSVVLLHPGFVRTEMTGGNGLIDADESAAGLLARIDALDLETSGHFFHQSGEELPW